MTTPVLQGREPWTRMVIAISGSSGLIGSALVRAFEQRGSEVRRLVRRATRAANEIAWDPARGAIDAARLEGVDAVVHLAGESLAQRWTSDVKRRIRDSRVQSTTLLARSLAALGTKPKVWLSGSAVGAYGSRGDEVLDETSPLGNDFLAEVCKEWEASTATAVGAGIRVVLLRSGVVLSRAGGLLPKMLMPFRIGAGGRLGSGRQWMSWISLDDYTRAVEELVRNDAVAGPVNIASPNPVTNEVFTHTLGRVLRRPTLFSVPAFAMKLVLGEMAEETALASQRVRPRRLLEAGFDFHQSTVESGLRTALK